MMTNFNSPVIQRGHYSPISAKGGRRTRRNKNRRTRSRRTRTRRTRSRRYH
jgi:hypothetical protein